jgi:hypothetical protein
MRFTSPVADSFIRERVAGKQRIVEDDAGVSTTSSC